MAERRERRDSSTDDCSGRSRSPRSARSANSGAGCGAPTDSADDALATATTRRLDSDTESLDDHLADTVHYVDLDDSASAVAVGTSGSSCSSEASADTRADAAVAVETVDHLVALAIGRDDGR